MMHEPVYTQDWATTYHSMWERLLPPPDHGGHSILEVGCFEGRSTTWFLQRYTHSSVCALDTFEGGLDHKELGLNFSEVEQRFLHNIQPWTNRVTLYKGLSVDALQLLNRDNHKFDIALIDGSHIAMDVLSDLVLTWPMLLPGGTLIMDDYGWGSGRPADQTPKPAIDMFLACLRGNYVIVEHGYQVLVRKL